MTKSYLNYKAVKKTFALKAIIVLITLGIIFLIILISFAISGTRRPDTVNEPPDNEVVYTIAKQFIKPGITSSDINFPKSGYQCAQKPDSVYIIKSYMELRDQSGKKDIITFEITMRYNGGNPDDKKNWKLLDLIKN